MIYTLREATPEGPGDVIGEYDQTSLVKSVILKRWPRATADLFYQRNRISRYRSKKAFMLLIYDRPPPIKPGTVPVALLTSEDKNREDYKDFGAWGTAKNDVEVDLPDAASPTKTKNGASTNLPTSDD